MSEKYEIMLDGAEWRKSPFSADDTPNCVEVAGLADGHVAVRDTQARERGAQIYTPEEWSAFLQGAKAGFFDDLGGPEA